MESYDVIIIGAGPAGMSAAIYALRGNLKVLILDKSAPGGKIVSTSDIQNWPGISKIDGPSLAYNMFEQILSLGAVYKYGNVLDIQINKNEKIVICDDDKYKTNCVIIATGSDYKKLNIPGSEKFEGKGISYCAVCDAKLYQDKKVALVGGGDSAFKEALYLANYAQEVVLIHRRDSFRASEDLINKVLNTSNILLYTPYSITKIIGDKFIEGIEITNQISNEIKKIDVEGIFPFIGSIPATSFAQKILKFDAQGYILVNNKMETNIPGIYAAGDIISKNLRQIITACNDGAIAGQNAIEYINSLK